MFSRLYICIYALHICIYGDIYPCAQPALHICLYIYMQHETLNKRAQATDAERSSSQHSITIQQNPPEATESFYQETSK